MGGKRDQKIRQKAQQRKAARNPSRGPYLDTSHVAALRAHDRILATFMAGMSGQFPERMVADEAIAKIAYLRGVSYAVKVLREEMKTPLEAQGEPAIEASSKSAGSAQGEEEQLG